MDGWPGYFTLTLEGAPSRMRPGETATGAVRREDPGAGVVWLQIPTKSMLMNTRRGQRMVDNCLHSEQRIAASAVVDGHVWVVREGQLHRQPVQTGINGEKRIEILSGLAETDSLVIRTVAELKEGMSLIHISDPTRPQ